MIDYTVREELLDEVLSEIWNSWYESDYPRLYEWLENDILNGSRDEKDNEYRAVVRTWLSMIQDGYLNYSKRMTKRMRIITHAPTVVRVITDLIDGCEKELEILELLQLRDGRDDYID